MTADQESIREAIGVLLDHAPDGSKVILFGSYARDTPEPSSDIDFLVVEPDVADLDAPPWSVGFRAQSAICP